MAPRADIEVRQSLSLPVIIQALVMLSGLAAVYANSVANDREHAAAINQLRLDLVRVERDSRELRADIRNDLKEIKDELREMRGEAARARKP